MAESASNTAAMNWKRKYDELVDKITAELSCPLTKRVPLDPVLANNGCIYERSELETNAKSANIPLYVIASDNIKRVIGLVSDANSGEERLEHHVKSKPKEDEAYSPASTSIQEDDKEATLAPASPEEKAALVKVMAEEGDVDSIFELGELYLKGKGVDQDEGYRRIKLAADKGHTTAKARVADCLLTGQGVARDYEAAYELLVEEAIVEKSGKGSTGLLSIHNISLIRSH